MMMPLLKTYNYPTKGWLLCITTGNDYIPLEPFKSTISLLSDSTQHIYPIVYNQPLNEWKLEATKGTQGHITMHV